MLKRTLLLVFLLALVSILGGCGGQAETSEPEAAIPSVEDQASLLAGLRATGATTEVGDTVIQDFFTPEGTIIKVNGEDVQVFEYENAVDMESEASQVAPDGSSVGTSMMMWVDDPHFYKSGRIIVLYIGSNSSMLDLFDEVTGQQFAGR